MTTWEYLTILAYDELVAAGAKTVSPSLVDETVKAALAEMIKNVVSQAEDKT